MKNSNNIDTMSKLECLKEREVAINIADEEDEDKDQA